MLLNDEVELLRRIPLFAQIGPSRLKLLAFTSERVSFEPGEVICQQGDPGEAAYVILIGTAEVLVAKQDGSLLSIATLEPDTVVGEMAIFAEAPRTATVRAITHFETLKIDKEQFLELVRESPDVAIELLRILARRATQLLAELAAARVALAQAQPPTASAVLPAADADAGLA